MWNTNEINYIRSQLRNEYFPKPKKDNVVSSTPVAAEDAKQEDKFEPFYEGENASNEPATGGDSQVETSSSSEKPKGKKSLAGL